MKKETVKKERIANDAYYTPWDAAENCIRALRSVLILEDMLTILEPSAGGGAFVQALLPWASPRASIYGFDIDPQARIMDFGHPSVSPLVQDFLKFKRVDSKFDLVVGNPPFCEAELHVRKALECGKNVAMLLPLAFLASKTRLPFWAMHPADKVFVLSTRPSFVHGSTDKRDYAFYVWMEDFWKGDDYRQIEHI